MGISNGLEIGSMDSETMSVCNKEPTKANGGHNDSDVVETACEIIDELKANHTINADSPMSPIPQEGEAIEIHDDHEPEEGEITNTDDEIVAIETAEFEYEAISSDEEFSLRQKIEALEARNLELEQIASISSRSMGYSRDNFNNFKTQTIENGPSHHHTNLLSSLNRKNLMRKIPPSNHSVTASNYKDRISLANTAAYVENISSDDGHSNDNEHQYSLNSDRYDRVHRATKKEKRRKKEKEKEKEKRHKQQHDDRKLDRLTTVKQQPFKPYSYSSESDNETLLRNREELILALNMNEQTRRSTGKSATLYDKLSVLQKKTHDDNRKSSSTKRKRCKSFDGPTRDSVKRKNDHSDDYKKKRKKPVHNHQIPLVSPIRDGDATEEDELHSLEEQELRLMALKSAVLKKHEARKKRQAATQQQTARPYSPTDSVIADESGERSNDCIDSDNNNMDISPISSPNNECQPMDMELASSNENSNSPIFCRNTIIYDEQYVDWGTSIAVPVPFNATYIEIDQSTPMSHSFPNMFGQNQMTAGFEPYNEETIDTTGGVSGGGGGVGVGDDSEDELRAQLIEQLRNQNSSNSNSGIETVTMTVVDDETQTKIDELSQVDTLEEDCLRSLLLSSKGKKSKSNDAQSTAPKIEATAQRISAKPDTKSQCDDMPKLTMNLREALKRLKGNLQKITPIIEKLKTEPKLEKPTTIKTKTTKSNNLAEVEQPTNKDTVNNETIKTAIEENKNELGVVTKTAVTASTVPLKRKPTEQLQPKNVPAKQNKISQKLGVANVTKKATTLKSTLTKTASTDQTTGTPKLVISPKNETETVAKTVTKAFTEKPFLAMNLDALRKSTSSPIITTWKPKPVKKLVISLNRDSSSDETDENDRENRFPAKTDLNSSTNPNNNDSSNAFQLRLDQFLQSVRKNTDANQEDTKKLPSTVAPAAKAAKKSVLTTKQAQPSSKVEESKAVRHLPMSSQLEYHRLISRMKLLEKQKEQKSRSAKTTPINQSQAQQPSSPIKPNPVKSESKFPKLTVFLQNDRYIQTDEETNGITMEKTKTLVQSTIKIPALPSTNNSLTKHVLVKNTIENLISEEVKLATTSSKNVTETSTIVSQKTSTTTLELSSVQKERSEQSANNNTNECPKLKATSSSISIAELAKETPKVQATVLANYEKRYRSQGDIYLNDLIKLHRLTARTNLETRKQHKLEQELNELRKKMKLIEESLMRQNNLTKSLYPAVASAEKNAITNRSQLLKLENSCNRLGAVVQSTDYKIQCDKQEDIKTKLKQISLEKCKLKLLDPMAVITISKKFDLLQTNAPKAAPKVVINHQQTVNSTPTETFVIEKPLVAIPKGTVTNQEASSAATNTVDPSEATITTANLTNDNQMPNEANEINIADIPKDENPPIKPEPVSEKPATEELVTEEAALEDSIPKELIEPSLQKNEHNIERESSVEVIALEANIKSPDEIFFSAIEISGNQSTKDDDTAYGKYSSPLEHLKCDIENESSLPEQSLDSIICPFDLMGRCEDKQCKYRHLST